MTDAVGVVIEVATGATEITGWADCDGTNVVRTAVGRAVAVALASAGTLALGGAVAVALVASVAAAVVSVGVVVETMGGDAVVAVAACGAPRMETTTRSPMALQTTNAMPATASGIHERRFGGFTLKAPESAAS